MINPKELMIGNYVEYDGQIYQMSHISKEGEPGLDTLDYGYGVVAWKDIYPIQLTEEWLIKFGWINNDRPYFWKDDFCMIKFNIDGSLNFAVNEIEAKIKHVNQLQNLYFALTGKELKQI